MQNQTIMNWLQKTTQQKLLIIARGPSGSGKSHMTKNLAEEYKAPIFSTDDFWMVDGEYQFNPKRLREAHRWNQNRTEEAMQNNEPIIIIDNTNVKFSDMKPYVQMAQKYQYNITFREPDWSQQLKNPDGKWNLEFLEEMQNQPDREKQVPLYALKRMVEGYEHDPTIEKILYSDRH